MASNDKHSDQHVDQYADDFVHGLLSEADAETFTRHCEQCTDCKAAHDRAIERKETLQELPRHVASDSLIRAVLEKTAVTAARRPSRFAKARKLRWKLYWGTVASAAIVILVCHTYYGTLRPSPHDLRVYGQRTLDAGANESLRVMLLNQETESPVENAEVQIELRSLDSQLQTRLASFSTDRYGSASPELQIPDWPAGQYRLVVSAQSGWREDVVDRRIELRRAGKLMLTSDKPVYQPGQIIHLRCLSLSIPDRKPMAGQIAEFTIRDPKGNLIYKQRTPTSRFGLASADCPLASELNHGNYQIACSIDKTTSDLTVEVRPYELPKFRIDASTDRTYYAPGEMVRLRVDAKYFFGKPVMGNVDARVYTTGVPIAEIGTFTESLNSEGEAELSFRLPERFAGLPVHAGDMGIAIDVRVTDPAGQQHERTIRTTATVKPLRIEVVHESGQVVPGVANRLYLFASYADGRPARVRISIGGFAEEIATNQLGLAVIESTPQDDSRPLRIQAVDENGLVANAEFTLRVDRDRDRFIMRTDRVVYDGGDTVLISVFGGGNQPVFIDLLKDGQTLLTRTVDVVDGAGQLALDLPAELSGNLRLCGYRFTTLDSPRLKTQPIVVRSASQVKLTATLDANEYRPGDRATVQFQLSDQDGRPAVGAVSLAVVDEAVFSVTSQRPGMEQAFFELDSELLEPGYVLYSSLPNDDLDTRPIDYELVRQATRARAHQVNTVQRNRLRNRIGSQRQFEEMMRTNSLGQVARQLDVTEEVARGVMTGAVPHSLSARTYPSKLSQSRSVRRSAGQVIVVSWLVFGLFTLSGSIVFFSRSLVQAIFIFAALFVLGLLLLPASNVARDAARMYANTGVGSATLDGENSDGLRGEVGEASIRLRQWFPETLLWRPEIITDEQGRIAIDVPLADSITDWRLTASAVTETGILGATNQKIRVFQPFFVDVNLPVALTRHDEVAVPVVVYNYHSQAQAIELTLDDSPWFELLDEPTRRIQAEPGEVRSEYFRIRVTKVGRHELTITALGDNGIGDAVKRTVQVEPNGQRVEEVVSGSFVTSMDMPLVVEADAVAGSVQSVVKIYPNSFSQLVEGLDGILQQPHGCFEQTSSTTYPNVLALDYLRRTNQSHPEVEAKARQYIHLGYQRLLTFEVGGGGFDWFGNPPANPLLTAYGLMEFIDMAEVHDVDPALIARTRKWLFSKRQVDGSWPPDRRRIHDDSSASTDELRRLQSTAYIAWAVYQGDDQLDASPTLQFLLRHEPAEIDSPYLLALVSNAILAIDPDCPALSSYLDRLVQLRQTSADEQLAFWTKPEGARTAFYGSGRTADIESTALATLALLAANEQPLLVHNALSWLVTQKDESGTWHSTQATVLALKALLAGTQSPSGGAQPRQVEILLDDDVIHQFNISAEQSDVVHQFVIEHDAVASNRRLSLRESSSTSTAYQIVFRQHVARFRQLGEDQAPFSIDVQYDRTSLHLNESVQATATVVNQTPASAPMLMVDLPIPAGFGVGRETLDQMQQSSELVEKYEITPRSIIVYLRNLGPRETLQIRYQLRALMPLRVTVPAARTYLYYDPSQKAAGRPQEIVVDEA